jgi:hypothetical protein
MIIGSDRFANFNKPRDIPTSDSFTYTVPAGGTNKLLVALLDIGNGSAVPTVTQNGHQYDGHTDNWRHTATSISMARRASSTNVWNVFNLIEWSIWDQVRCIYPSGCRADQFRRRGNHEREPIKYNHHECHNQRRK